MDDRNIFGRRLSQARRMNGLSMEELGKALTPAISRQAINKYEKGMTMPDSRMLLSFCAALNVKPDYFFRSFTVEEDCVKFRKDVRFSEKESSAMRERVREELERYLEAEQLCGSSTSFTLSPRDVSSVEDICRYAEDVRTQLKLGTDGISNVIEVLEDSGIKIIEVSEDESFDGLSGYANENIPLIVINDNLAPERKRFTLLHELGHLLMRFGVCTSDKDIEQGCNIFASEMLIPKGVLFSRLGKKRHDISLTELTDIQSQYGISIDSIMAALCRHNVISAGRLDGYKKKKHSYPDFKSDVERSSALPETSGRFVRMVYRALADEIISYSKAASLLNTSVESVKNCLQLV